MIQYNIQTIQQSKVIIDNIFNIALSGANSDKIARSMILSGFTGILTSVGLLAISGVIGPKILIIGLLNIPNITRISLYTSTLTMLAGFIKGFKIGAKNIPLNTVLEKTYVIT